MKKLVFALACGALGPALAEGRLVRAIPFESEKEIQAWPGDCTVELDDEEKVEGEKSIVFTPDNNFCAYVWQRYAPGKPYTATFRVKAEKPPIPRIAFAVNFKKADGTPAGSFSKPIRDLVTCDNTWQSARVTFVCPPEAVRGQTMFAMFRCNTTVFIDDFKLYEGEAPAASVAAAATAPASGGKRKLLLEVTFDGPAPTVTNVREVR